MMSDEFAEKTTVLSLIGGMENLLFLGDEEVLEALDQDVDVNLITDEVYAEMYCALHLEMLGHEFSV